MTLAALAYTQIVRSGGDPGIALMAAIVVGATLGILHLPILLQVGPYLILVITVVAQIVLSQFWLAVPDITGGSGGLLLPGKEIGLELSAVLLALFATAWYEMRNSKKAGQQFDFAAIRDLGIRAGALGVPSLRIYVSGFLLYGVILSVCGVAAARMLGYLTADLFGLSWSLTNLLIILIARGRSFAVVVLLAAFYVCTRIGLRQILMASPMWSHGLEVLFPALLLIIFSVSELRLRMESRIGFSNDRSGGE
jgi:ABC-type branched-subunit amino acid transport system permease subunit